MPSTRDLLQRFRPAGAPGAMATTGVPADRNEERNTELAGMFALLEETVAQAEGIRLAVTAQVLDRRDRARNQALATVAQARLDAEVLRREWVADARTGIALSRDQGSEQAEQRGHEIEREALRTRNQDVITVVAAVRDLVVNSDRMDESS